MNKTSISYADLTWNPFLGCSHASDGCRNCYAERLASTRLAHLPAYQGLTANGRWNGTVRLLPERMDEPLRRRRPAVIFVGDMGDLFHPNLPFDYVAAIFGVMAACPQHTFLTLTKRPERMVEFMKKIHQVPGNAPGTELMEVQFQAQGYFDEVDDADDALMLWPKKRDIPRGTAWPLPNWWAGVTVENQREADRRIPLLLQTPAAHRWVSAEPLLGPIRIPSTGIDQLIVGGESGPGARPCDVEWIRSLRDQCAEAGTKCYVKQLGANVVDDAACGIGKAVCARPGSPMHDPAEWPADLRVRELGWRP